MIVCIIRLGSDAVSWAFDGLPGIFWGIITRFSNYATFVANDLVSLIFSVFLWNLVKGEDEKPGIVLKAYWALECGMNGHIVKPINIKTIEKELARIFKEAGE